MTELVTDRLVLRTWTEAEANAVVNGARSAEWADDFPAEGDREIAGLLAQNRAWLDERGHRLMIERASGLVVGAIGLFWPPREGKLEIGYGIVPSRRGRGYTTEAAKALAGFALTAPDVDTVFADVELTNPASMRVLEKAGFQPWGTKESRVRFRLTRGDLVGAGRRP